MRTQITTNGLLRSARKALKRPLSSVRSEKEQITAHHPLLYLQRLAGNQAAGRFLQAKLNISQPGDKYEQEADMMADRVMQAPESASIDVAPVSIPHFQRKCADCASGQGLCPTCGEEEETLQRKAQARKAGNGAPSASPIVENKINSLRGGGQPLAPSVRSFFEPRFGYDFSQVRIHTDTRAAESARTVNARAYTLGSDIVFGPGQYAPASAQGRKLLAHELTHVVQQSGAQSQMVQRQIKFDPCIESPLGRACGSDAAKVCEKFPGLPGCDAICKTFGCKKPEKPPTPKPSPCPGRETPFGGCCEEGEIWTGLKCEPFKLPPSFFCPPDRRSIDGRICCEPDEIWSVIEDRCVPRPVTPPKPPVTRPTTLPSAMQIFFNLDRPAPGTSGVGTLDRDLTSKGRSNFKNLVKRLKDDPKLKVQLVGRASPEGEEKYNLDLGRRRAEMIAEALDREGIDRSRIADPPESDLRGECEVVATGLHTCGEAGAAGEEDRHVLARIFKGE